MGWCWLDWQPLLVEEGDSLFIIQGCYDHHLKKLNAETGKLINSNINLTM